MTRRGISPAQPSAQPRPELVRRLDRDLHRKRRPPGLLADPHAWAEFRANGPLGNIDAFYEAFGVKPSDKLYRAPDKRVKIW